MDKPRVRVFLDDDPHPIIDQELPTDVSLDTRALEDGPHRLTIRAQDQNGREGVEEIPFQVHNGPGIVVSGLRAPFDPPRQRALYRGCVQYRRSIRPPPGGGALLYSGLGLGHVAVLVAWAVWYAARMWDVPAEYAKTPTYATHGKGSPP